MKKTYEEIAKDSLSYLKKFGFTFRYEWNTPYRRITLQKNNNYIMFEELPQFQEAYIYVVCNQIKKEIKLNNEQLLLYIKNINSDYWDMIINLFKNEIEKSGTLYGISLD